MFALRENCTLSLDCEGLLHIAHIDSPAYCLLALVLGPNGADIIIANAAVDTLNVRHRQDWEP